MLIGSAVDLDHTWQAAVHGDHYITHCSRGWDGIVMIILDDGRWTVDGYIIITVYLHKTPVTPSPWNIACYMMITVDHRSPSMINHCLFT